MTDDKLKMTFTPNTIEHLGVRLYSTIPPVIAELVANSYDAGAKKVEIRLNDKDQSNKEISVEDNGHGMSFDDINNKFLRIGRNRRAEEEESKPNRLVIGKKGLGKLSFFGIAQTITVSTTKDGVRNVFELKWDKIVNKDNLSKETDTYSPDIIERDEKDDTRTQGTTITLKDMTKGFRFNAKQLAANLSRFFIIDNEMDIFVEHNEESPVQVKNEMKYEDLDTEITWEIPKGLDGFKSDYANKDKIVGKLFATKKPIPPSTSMRGITLFSRKKLVNNPGYFADSTSSHFFSYLTGWFEVDFIDELDSDVIQTNRQSVNWDDPEMEKLHNYLQEMIKWLAKDWRVKRKEAQGKKISDTTGINLKQWADTMPDDIKPDFTKLINSLSKNVDLPDKEEQVVESVKSLHGIIPEYPALHWRHLHPTLRATVENYYKAKDYYNAVYQGVMEYMSEVETKTGSSLTDRALLENIFSIKPPENYSVVAKYKRPDGRTFHAETVKNIKEGHRGLVIAMWQAFRCPIAHDPVADLRDSGLYTEKDCLDALSLLSHMFRRLDDLEDTTASSSATA